MNFGDFYRNLRESVAQALREGVTDGVFRVEVAGVDEGDAQIAGVPELVVFDVGGDEGVAAGIIGVQQLRGAGAAADSDGMDGLSAGRIAQAPAAKGILPKESSII